MQDANGDVYKMRIRVKVTSSIYGETLNVVEKYYTSRYYAGGEWIKIPNTMVVKCNPYHTSSPLESQFMYKSNIDGGLTYWYFDL